MKGHSLDGWVYLLCTKDKSYYKIGSSLHFKRRYKEIKLQLPFAVELHSAFYCHNFRLVEKYLHFTLRDMRLNGEWFSYDMPIVFGSFITTAFELSTSDKSYFLDDDLGWISIALHNALFPLEV